MRASNLIPVAGNSVKFAPAVRLSSPELEVLHLVAAGHRSRDAAEILALSKRTIDFHLARVFEKLGANNRIQAVRTAWGLGILPFEPPFFIPRRY